MTRVRAVRPGTPPRLSVAELRRLAKRHQQPQRSRRMDLPDIEKVAAKVHHAWMVAKKASGIHSRISETGEELMKPFAELSEAAKELDRASVRAVYAAIEEAAREAG